MCQSLGGTRLPATPCAAAHQPPLSMGFSRQGYWSGLPFPSPGDLSKLAMEPGCPALQTDSLLTAVQKTWVGSLGWDDPLEKEMANHSSILAWKIPWTEQPREL